jgi:hypothetical protein
MPTRSRFRSNEAVTYVIGTFEEPLRKLDAVEEALSAKRR